MYLTEAASVTRGSEGWTEVGTTRKRLSRERAGLWLVGVQWCSRVPYWTLECFRVRERAMRGGAGWGWLLAARALASPCARRRVDVSFPFVSRAGKQVRSTSWAPGQGHARTLHSPAPPARPPARCEVGSKGDSVLTCIFLPPLAPLSHALLRSRAHLPTP